MNLSYEVDVFYSNGVNAAKDRLKLPGANRTQLKDSALRHARVMRNAPPLRAYWLGFARAL